MPKSSDVQITQLDIKESELYNPHTVQKVYHFQTRQQTTGRFSCGRNLLFVGIKTLKAFFVIMENSSFATIIFSFNGSSVSHSDKHKVASIRCCCMSDFDKVSTLMLRCYRMTSHPRIFKSISVQ